MGVVIVGLSYKTAPVAIRERIAFTKEEIPPALRKLVSLEGISSAMILSTCNRVELLAEAEDEIGAIHISRKFLHEHHKIDGGEIDSSLYEMTGVAAIRHIFRVASGLDSMVLGECQILGQLKDAYSYSVQSQCMHGTLNQLIIETFRVAKHVRTLTSISMAGSSVSRAAVEFAKGVFGDLTQRTILVVGAGKMSELTTLHLCRMGAVKVLVTNRTYDHAAALAARFQGTAIPFQELSSALSQADIVITSVSGSADYVITRADVERALRQREHRSMLFIDIAVPRNIEPCVMDLQNAFLCDIDGLKAIVAGRESEIVDMVANAERIVESELNEFTTRQRHRDMGPVISMLKSRIQSISCSELERHICRLTAASAKDRETLEAMVQRIANKILHPLIVALKRQESSCDISYLETLALAFAPSQLDEGARDKTALYTRSQSRPAQ